MPARFAHLDVSGRLLNDPKNGVEAPVAENQGRKTLNHLPVTSWFHSVMSLKPEVS